MEFFPKTRSGYLRAIYAKAEREVLFFPGFIKNWGILDETWKRTSQPIAAAGLATLMRNDHGLYWFCCTQVKINYGCVLQVMHVKSSCQLMCMVQCIIWFTCVGNRYLQCCFVYTGHNCELVLHCKVIQYTAEAIVRISVWNFEI